MAKTKQRQLVVLPANKSKTPSDATDLSNFDTDLDLHGEDSWVIVKKQRITILVPPLPAVRKSMTPNLGSSPASRNQASNQSQLLGETCPSMPSLDEQEKSIPLAPSNGNLLTRKAPPAQHITTLAKPRRLALRIESGDPADRVYLTKSCNILRVSNTSKAIRLPRQLPGPGSFCDGATLLNQRLKALNLERKLQKAGGLSRWLASEGLGQFVRIFQVKNVNKLQLVNLSMKKLKDMGANAVGPRRKLMHAINRLCAPYYFEAF